MTRKKVKLAYITNDSARKATFKKRKKGLMKKVSELSTLCGIDACAIIYSPYDTHPEVWPSPMDVQRVLTAFKKMPEMEQSKKMVNQESFLRQRIAKANEQLKKQRKENREKEVTQVMFQGLTGRSLHNLTMMDLNDLGWVIEQNLKEVNKRIESLGNKVVVPPNNSQPTATSMAGSSHGTDHGDHNKHNAAAAAHVVQQGGGEMIMRSVSDHMNMDSNMQRQQQQQQQQQQWLMELINPQDNLGCFGAPGDDMILPNFGDNNNTTLWSNPFFP